MLPPHLCLPKPYSALHICSQTLVPSWHPDYNPQRADLFSVICISKPLGNVNGILSFCSPNKLWGSLHVGRASDHFQNSLNDASAKLTQTYIAMGTCRVPKKQCNQQDSILNKATTSLGWSKMKNEDSSHVLGAQ